MLAKASRERAGSADASIFCGFVELSEVSETRVSQRGANTNEMDERMWKW